MKSLVAMLIVGASFGAVAQEINDTSKPPVVPAPNDNPYANPYAQPSSGQNPPPPPPPTNPGQKSSYAYKPQASSDKPVAPVAPAWDPALKKSASAGTFGIRAGFGATGVAAVPTGTITATTSLAAPSIGVSFLASDGFKLLLDLGFGFGLNTSSGASLYAFGANLGFDYLFRTPLDALRPLLHFSAQFSLAGSGSADPVVGFGFQLAGGAEYFLSPNFAVYGRIGVAVPMSVPGGSLVLGFFTLTPGLGATFYF